jgi:hypothetical protein
MEAATATNIITFSHANKTTAISETTTTGDVFSPDFGKNEQFGTHSGEIRDSFGDFLANELAAEMEKADREQAATNVVCKALIKTILCNPAIARSIRGAIRDANGEYITYAYGMEAMLQAFDAGAIVKITSLVEQTAAAHPKLTKTFQMDKIKPIFETQQILLKREDNSFRWADIDELKAQKATLYITENVQPVCNDVQPTYTERATPVRISNPLVHLRNWQQTQALKKAKGDIWCKVNADGTVDRLSKPLQGDISEKDKELARKAAFSEARSKLEGKIASAGDKELQAEIRRTQLETEKQRLAILNEASLKAAQMQARRIENRERLASYKPIAIAAACALVAIALYNADPTSTNMNTVDASMPAPYGAQP